MEIISDLDEFTARWPQCVLTLGDFDGLHRGHRKLINTAVRMGEKLKLPAIVVTYDPSPKKVLKKLKTDSNIYTRQEKVILLQKFNLRAVVFLAFNKKMAKMQASVFLQNIIIDKLRARHIVIGYDHTFGHNRHGNFNYLKKAGQKHHFTVEQIKPVRLFRETVSSTKIRSYLENGNVKKANRLLGHAYMMQGTVVLGKQRGRLLGIPTANLHVDHEKLIPGQGVYYCMAQYGPKLYRSVVNIGFNPTFQNNKMTIEAHILNFNSEVYGEVLKLFFIQRIRNEKKFSSIGDLKKQIQKDIEKVQKLPLPENL